MTTHYRMRCADCGNEGTMTRVNGVCPECGFDKEVYTCICGCKLEMCLDCLNTLTPPRVHHWRVVAETESA
ncbi:MAG: hypothetical protein ACRYFS_24570 [Janthinobacterium lividum]